MSLYLHANPRCFVAGLLLAWTLGCDSTMSAINAEQIGGPLLVRLYAVDPTMPSPGHGRVLHAEVVSRSVDAKVCLRSVAGFGGLLGMPGAGGDTAVGKVFEQAVTLRPHMTTYTTFVYQAVVGVTDDLIRVDVNEGACSGTGGARAWASASLRLVSELAPFQAPVGDAVAATPTADAAGK